MKKIYLFLIILLVFTACDTKPNFRIENSENGFYSIKVADYMEATDKLNNNASMQFQEDYREIYLIVIDEQKSFLDPDYDLKKYFKFAQDNIIKSNLTDTETTEPVEKDINGLNALQGTVVGKYNLGTKEKEQIVEVFYSFIVLESENRFYQVFTWTLANKRKRYEPLLQEMLESFKENPNPPTKNQEENEKTDSL